MRPAGSVAGRLGVLAAAVVLSLAPAQTGQAYLTPAERQGLDLSKYTVTDRNESYFDVAARMALLARTKDPLLAREAENLAMGLSCREQKAQPVIAEELSLPSFYDNPEAWEVAATPLLAFEQKMSQIVGVWVASRDPYYAHCLVDILEQWAKADALYEFQFSTRRPQAWYAIESMIFSAALALSTVTGQVNIAPDRRRTIERWLKRVAKHHFNTKGPSPSCCNNHYYRRALYMTVVGVVTGDDGMFQTGLRSVFSALDDIGPRGEIELALKRGWRAVHYQNYSLLYLVMTMQVAYRQGYDLFGLEARGRGFKDAVAFLMRCLADPYDVPELPPGEQDLTFTNDEQYLGWMEIWLSHFSYLPMERFVRLHRPLFNRGAGGHLTLYFKRPEGPGAVMKRELVNAETERMSPSEIGARYPYLEKWRRAR